MTEARSSVKLSANSVASADSERLRYKLVAGGILIALALAVVLLRLQRLSEVPPGIDAGEGANGMDALRVLQGEHKVFFPEKFDGREGLVMYAIALSISLFGRTEFALRLPTALASAGTVFLVFWLGLLLFGRDEESGRASPWRGTMVGGAGAGMLAVSLSQTIMGRTAFRTSLLPFFLCLCLAFLWQGWSRRERGREWWLLALAGVCAGLLPYTYIPARFVPFLFLFFGLSFLPPLRAVANKTDGVTSRRTGVTEAIERARAEIPRILLFVGVTALVAAPILLYFALHPEQFNSRSKYIWIFSPIQSQGNPVGALLVNVWEHLLAFGFQGDPNWRHNFDARPLLNPFEAFFFWIGVGMAVWRWKRGPAYRLLLLWLCILLMAAFWAKDTVPNTLRMIGAVPAAYLLMGVGIWEALRFLKDRFSWARGSRAALGAGSVVGLMVFVQGLITYRTYFGQWAAAPQTYESYQSNWTELARFVGAQPPDKGVVYLIPGYTPLYPFYLSEGFGYLYQGPAQTQLVSVGASNLAPLVQSSLAELKDISTIRFVDWDNDKVSGDARADRQIFHLLGKYGRYQGSEWSPSFQIHTYSKIALDRLWTFYDYLEPPAIDYDGGISLLGFAWGQGTEQLSLQEPFILGNGQTMWVATRWHGAPGLEIEYSISLRLHAIEGGAYYQQDAVLRNLDFSSTRFWSAGESVDTLHFLDLPADLAPGEYEMRLVVYDFATLKPTVEIGVWEAETVLTRLNLEAVH